MTLSPDERTVLLIAAESEPMMPIGRWKPAVEALVARGYLKPHPHPGDPTGHFNHRITDEGKAALPDMEAEDDAALRDIILRSNHIGHQQAKLRATAEAIAVQLVDLAEASVAVTGDEKTIAIRNWSRVILVRAEEMLR